MTLHAVADFCLIPMGTNSTSVGAYIAECQRVLEAQKQENELTHYECHGYGTNLEGTFAAVSKAIELCHEAVHKMGVSFGKLTLSGLVTLSFVLACMLRGTQKAPRIATDIRIGTRIDKGPDSTQQEWEKGLGENERKRESVRRHLQGLGGNGSGEKASSSS